MKFFNRNSDSLPAIVRLKTGQSYKVTLQKDKTYSPNSFTKDTIHRFPGRNIFGPSQFFVSGDNIAVIEY